ncbi:MAG: chorismate mutase [Anaerolineales bacterium]|nr:chorismate mutase [Anaerolineales bacterium]
MPVRGIRGAVQVEADTAEAISHATRDLLLQILESNPSLAPQDLASVFFTVTDDLCADYPALAARTLPGWQMVPLLCGREIPVTAGLPRTLRVLMHWNTDLAQDQVAHVYLGPASRLRPDLHT